MTVTSILKPSLILSGVAGTCCATSLLATMDSNNSHISGKGDSSTNLPNNYSGRNASSTQLSTFDEIWSEINATYKQQQSSSGNEIVDLPWKNNLQQILLKDSPTNQRSWSIQSQEWINCLTTIEGRSTNCGYIYLNGENFSYKLRVNYEYLRQKGSWSIYMVRKNNQGEINFYDLDNWTRKQVNFEILSASIHQGDSQWSGVNLAFKQ